MSDLEIRKPIQKRSIKKKDTIVEKGFELICNKGYYNTNTAEIAKYAGVSTGIIYNYFKDKHDILIEALERFSDNVFYPILSLPKKEENLTIVIEKIIKTCIKDHKLSDSAHKELMAMTYLDEQVEYYFKKREMDVTQDLYNVFIENGCNKNNLMEKSHIILGIIDNICHECVYHKHKDLKYEIMEKEAIDIIVDLLNKE